MGVFNVLSVAGWLNCGFLEFALSPLSTLAGERKMVFHADILLGAVDMDTCINPDQYGCGLATFFP